MNPIKVLVVDDSKISRELLARILGEDTKIQVIGTAGNKEDAINIVQRRKPDVIAMDVNMSGMRGCETTRQIMEICPTPIIIVAGTQDVEKGMCAMEAGALAIVEKPGGADQPDHKKRAAELVQTVKLMSEVKVIRRRPMREVEAPMKHGQIPEIKLVAIGASTGGPPVIQTILSRLPKDFNVPILIVQHMAAGFIEGFVEWLGQASALPVHVAKNGSYILPGNVYVAPDRVQMKVDISGRISLTKDIPENGLLPSVSYLFRSVAQRYGNNAVGVLLTGMGKDGAAELKLMKEAGAITIAQDNESSAVHGMPGVAIDLDATVYVLPPEAIADALINLTRRNSEE